jgi:hypothetical protein
MSFIEEGNMFNHLKRLFQLSLITIFASLLFLGVAGTPTAQAEILEGLFKGKEYCNDGEGKAVKRKIKDPFVIDIDRSGTDILATITFPDGSQIDLDGVILSKNAKSGVFELTGTSGFTEFALNGKYKLTGTGDLKIVRGVFQGQDLLDLPPWPCLWSGKFKAKANPPG